MLARGLVDGSRPPPTAAARPVPTYGGWPPALVAPATVSAPIRGAYSRGGGGHTPPARRCRPAWQWPVQEAAARHRGAEPRATERATRPDGRPGQTLGPPVVPPASPPGSARRASLASRARATTHRLARHREGGGGGESGESARGATLPPSRACPEADSCCPQVDRVRRRGTRTAQSPSCRIHFPLRLTHTDLIGPPRVPGLQSMPRKPNDRWAERRAAPVADQDGGWLPDRHFIFAKRMVFFVILFFFCLQQLLRDARAASRNQRLPDTSF